MRSELSRTMLLAAVLILTAPPELATAGNSATGRQAARSGDQQYVGTWVGSYGNEGGESGNLSYTLSKDEKGMWRGTVKYTNQDGAQTGELKGLRIADGKMTAKLDSPDGEVEISIEGQFQGDRCEGTYSVSRRDSTEVTEKGTWKVAKDAAPKNER